MPSSWQCQVINGNMSNGWCGNVLSIISYGQGQCSRTTHAPCQYYYRISCYDLYMLKHFMNVSDVMNHRVWNPSVPSTPKTHQFVGKKAIHVHQYFKLGSRQKKSRSKKNLQGKWALNGHVFSFAPASHRMWHMQFVQDHLLISSLACSHFSCSVWSSTKHLFSSSKWRFLSSTNGYIAPPPKPKSL